MALNTTNAPTWLSHSRLHHLSTATPLYYNPNPALISWLPDHLLTLAAPIVAYWALSLFFHFLDNSSWKWLDRYRIHESAEVKSRNLVTVAGVVKAVLLQQAVQTVIAWTWLDQTPAGDNVNHLANMLRLSSSLARILRTIVGDKTAGRMLEINGAHLLYAYYWWAIPIAKFFIGMFVMDTWQYFLHRAMHMNTYLYKKFHSVHHRLYVPYAFGALYNHPLEGLLLDTCGAGISEAIAHMSTREAMFLFVVSTLKTVDDHCGYNFPWDPLQMFSGNNADYHDIHHQVIGIKSNFSQPFFVHWDAILGTRMTRKDMETRRQRKQVRSE